MLAPAFRVLVVDDNAAIHEHFRMILAGEESPNDDALDELEGELFESAKRAPEEVARFTLDSAYQGQEAVAMVRAATAQGQPYALAFVDVRMPPGMDGIETLGHLWACDPRIQAVICTAYSDHSWNDIVTSLGHSDGLLVLHKPFNPIEAKQLTHALTRKWRLSRQVERQLGDLETLVQTRTADLQKTNAQLRVEISQRVQVEGDLKHLASHDPLTGLPNRILLNDRLSTAIRRAERHHASGAVLLLDLDHFKDVNDAFGHAAGDELLNQVARRLTGAVRGCDTVARMGGDEFVVILEDLKDRDDAAMACSRILAACSQPSVVHGQPLHTPPSIGIAMFPEDGSAAEGLLKSADLAMYQAKRAGGQGFKFYTEGMFASTVERVEMRQQLDLALAREEFQLWYQPIVKLATGTISGMEALVRWRHPELGLVPPMKFIPTAEQCGLIVPLGAWVLRTACRQLAAWHAQGARDLSVAVNVSPRQLRAADFVDTVRQAVSDSGVDPRFLEIEITETDAMEDDAAASHLLNQIAALGVRIVIDDFGAGYSSLLRMKKMPIHAIKIDRFFLKDVVDDPRDAAIVTAIVNMAHALEIGVVAEGVECVEQLDFLKGMARAGGAPLCETFQGFLFSRPLPSDAATTLLFTTRARTTPRLAMTGSD